MGITGATEYLWTITGRKVWHDYLMQRLTNELQFTQCVMDQTYPNYLY
jgi:hypothetical protein